jgi:uncharacterized protein (DUF433 family)
MQVDTSRDSKQTRGATVKDRAILGREPVFRGTRVPFKILMEYLEGGDTLDSVP